VEVVAALKDVLRFRVSLFGCPHAFSSQPVVVVAMEMVAVAEEK